MKKKLPAREHFCQTSPNLTVDALAAVAMAPRINIPPVTRALLAALLFQSFLSAAIRYRQWTEHADIVIPYLTLVPGLSLIYPWTFLTSSLVEGNVFTLAIGGATLFYGGRYLERAWSSRELAKFLALVSLVPNFLTFCVLIVFYTLTRNEGWTYVLKPLPPGVSSNLSPIGSLSSPAPSRSRYPSSSHSASSSRRTP